MRLSKYFIEHPVIAVVLNLMVVVVGLLTYHNLSLREYPEVELPVLNVVAHYPNASAELVESAVTNVLENQLAGVEGLDEMNSSSHAGSSHIELRFEEGASLDRALMAVRDAVGLARSGLPKEVFEPVVQRKSKVDGLPFIAVSVIAENMDFGELTHYAELYLKNAFRSLKGVASVDVWGQPYTMSITLDPQKMYAFGINADEVYSALERNNLSWPVGKFHDEIPSTLLVKLNTVRDFENILLKENNGKPIYLKSIADIHLKTDDKQFRVRINGKPGLVLSISRTSDSNPLIVAQEVRAKLEALSSVVQNNVQLGLAMDQSEIIRVSLHNIKSSIFEAIILVLIIVWVFLRNFRATLIPVVTIPISLIGGLIFIYVMGFSINTITLLAMVLSIGLVVDDAIVVLENISRHLENGLTPVEAAKKGSQEIGFAIVAMTLTLASVYMPIAFIKGALGKLFVEFAVALAGSVVISGAVALILSPMMCSRILKSHEQTVLPTLDKLLNSITLGYKISLLKILPYTKTVFGLLGAMLISTILLYQQLPKEIAPKEDRSFMGVYIAPDPGKDINYSEKMILKAEALIKDLPEKQSYLTFMGNWGATICLPLVPTENRARTSDDIKNYLQPILKALPSTNAMVWSWDSGLPGLDDAVSGSGITMAISTINSYQSLLDYVRELRKTLESKKLFTSAGFDLNLSAPGYNILVDLNTISQLGLTLGQIARTIEIFFSGSQALYFEKNGIRYPITLIGKPSPWTLNELYLTTAKSNRVSLGTFAKLEEAAQPKDLNHHNQMRSTMFTVTPQPGQKIENTMKILQGEVQAMQKNAFSQEWVGAARAFQQSSMTMVVLFGLALLFIYAILTIQFENFLDPLLIMFTVPLASMGALLAALLCHQSINIYSQIGLITLIGLITKHGILVVEFANQLVAEGIPLQEAVMQAAVQRLRPILMTTSAMIFGTIPLISSHGAGNEARAAIGIVLIGGLLVGTFFTLFILPKIYLTVKNRSAN